MILTPPLQDNNNIKIAYKVHKVLDYLKVL